MHGAGKMRGRANTALFMRLLKSLCLREVRGAIGQASTEGDPILSLRERVRTHGLAPGCQGSWKSLRVMDKSFLSSASLSSLRLCA